MPQFKESGIKTVELAGSTVVEQKTETNAVGGVLTFADEIEYIGIYNTDATNKGIFTVNGIAIHIPAEDSAEFRVGGTPSNTVTVSGSTSYIVTRYV